MFASGPERGARVAGAAGALALAAALLALPHALSFSQKEIAVVLVINVLLVASYRFLTLVGEWSLGHAVIMGVGAYSSALLAKRLGVPVPLAMPLGACAAALVAYALSFPLFRMKGFYFLIGSFAAGEIIRLLWKRFREPFGGPKGIKSIPEFPSIDLGFAEIDFYEPENYYYLCLLVAAASIWVMRRAELSPLGLTLRAVHWRDKTAESVGVNARRFRTTAFVVASFFAGLAGALLAHYIGAVSPNRFNIEEMVFVLAWVIVGGTATVVGPILGAVILTVINEVVLRELGLEQARPLFYGAVLIAAVLFLPGGLEGLGPRLAALARRRRERRRPGPT